MRVRTLIAGLCCGIFMAPVISLATDTAPVTSKQTVSDTPFVIVAPSEEIIVTFPLFLVERGVVESVDTKDNTFVLKQKDGNTSVIKVTDNTLVENVYADIFTWESKKGIHDLKKGDKVRARVFPGDNGAASSAISLDVYKF
jgi:hypothetical protein